MPAPTAVASAIRRGALVKMPKGPGKGGLKLPVDRDALSGALGRSNAVHVALIDQKAADRVMHHLGRWLNFKGCSNAPLDSAALGCGRAGPYF